jgi:carbonic anhydrase
MSCPKSTAPVNIPTVGNECSLKCNFSHNYPSSELNVTNQGEMLNFRMNNSIQTEQVEYGNSSYNVQEFLIFCPSVHTFVGEYADAELMIVHNNNMGKEQLAVCIPLMMSNTPNDNSIVLDNILSEVGKRANSAGSVTQVNLASFNLNKFIPKKPYIMYDGTFDCNGDEKNNNMNFVVFRKQDAVKITPSSMELLNKIIKKQTMFQIKSTPPKKGFLMNKNGPSSGTTSNEDIYIECNPTGSDGEILVPIASVWSISADTMNLSNVGMIIGIILGVIIMCILIKLLQYILSLMKSDQKSDSANAADTK